MDVSVIIVTYNSVKYIPTCFASIKKYMRAVSYEIVVVDNDSADGTVPLIREIAPEVHVIENKFNVGFGKACNQGAAVAQGDFLFLLNADTELLNDGIHNAVKYARQQSVAVIGPRTRGSMNQSLKTWKHYNSVYRHMADLIGGALHFNDIIRPKLGDWIESPTEVMFLVGSAMLIARDAYDRIGLFDEQFFFTGEERDFCMRVTQAGLTLVYFPAWQIRHDVGHGKAVSAFHYVNWVKSSLKLARKHAGLIGVALMAMTLGLYTFSHAALFTLRQFREPNAPEVAVAARTYRQLFYWYLGILSEKTVLGVE